MEILNKQIQEHFQQNMQQHKLFRVEMTGRGPDRSSSAARIYSSCNLSVHKQQLLRACVKIGRMREGHVAYSRDQSS